MTASRSGPRARPAARRGPSRPAALAGPAANPAAEAWFAAQGWTPFPFQREVWQAFAAAESGLLHATTGSGKTYAVWLGALDRAMRLGQPARSLQVLWLTPMRALASDTTRALLQPLEAMAPGFSVAQRTGDTPSAERARQERRWPSGLVTTPESLTLMLSRERAAEELASVHTVVVDEWHELIGNKRGVQVQLALARLRRWNPLLVTWGLSATIGNLGAAMQTLLAPNRPGRLVQGRLDKALVVDTLLPDNPGRFSWGGHLGAQMLDPVVREIENSGPTLVFTNVRSQAEIWYQLLLGRKPEWAGLIALHHGSIDKAIREWVELALKRGELKAVVATTSLDLGVDFLPVERVLQIGSAKGVARLLQRAGRSGHAPGRTSRITLVPTNTLELVEAAAARRAALAGRVEDRIAPEAPLDVLVQHLVTIALGGGFSADELFLEVRNAWSYRALARSQFDWAMAFCERGGESLGAYPEYHRIARVEGPEGTGSPRWRVPDRGIAKRHRLQIGTIVAEASMHVKWLGGGTIGTIEEGFIARLSKGDHFVFAGRVLEFVRAQDMHAYVRRASKPKGLVPAWAGSKMSFSTEMSDALLAVLDATAQGDFFEPELQAARPMLDAQQRLSKLPRAGRLLVETWTSREGHHCFLYPYAGRHVHTGLAQLLAWRLARDEPNTYSLSVNDHGLEIVGARPLVLDTLFKRTIFSTERLLTDVLASLNSGQLAQRRFREIARIAGLVFGGYPGAPKSTRQLQASSSLFFEVFRKYDSGNRLLSQAEEEVLAQELEIGRLRATLERLQRAEIDHVELHSISPFALPLMVERLREQLSTEKLKDRLERLLAQAEGVLAAEARPTGAGETTAREA